MVDISFCFYTGGIFSFSTSLESYFLLFYWEGLAIDDGVSLE